MGNNQSNTKISNDKTIDETIDKTIDKINIVSIDGFELVSLFNKLEICDSKLIKYLILDINDGPILIFPSDKSNELQLIISNFSVDKLLWYDELDRWLDRMFDNKWRYFITVDLDHLYITFCAFPQNNVTIPAMIPKNIFSCDIKCDEYYDKNLFKSCSLAINNIVVQHKVWHSENVQHNYNCKNCYKIIILNLYNYAYLPEDINYTCPDCWYTMILDDTAQMNSKTKKILNYLFSINNKNQKGQEYDDQHEVRHSENDQKMFTDDEIAYIENHLQQKNIIDHLKKIITSFWQIDIETTPTPFYFADAEYPFLQDI